MIYSSIKKLLPYSIRSFFRDLDSAYQERLKEIEQKDQKILDLDAAYQENLKEIDRKNEQILSLKNSYQELLHQLDVKEQYIQEQEKLTKGSVNSSLSDDEFEELSKSGLFIVGNARSGTSILCDCLNLSPDVFLMGEANIFLNYNIDNFVEYYNNQHLQFKNCRFKGTFIPPSRTPEKGGLKLLSRLRKNYRFIGEKIAFGPHGDINSQSTQELFFMFHATYFYFSQYILILRRPTESIWSMLKMFPDRSKHLLFESWLRTIKIQIDVFNSFPNAYVIFLENISNERISNLCSLIGINIEIPKGMIRESNKLSLLDEYQIPDELSKYSSLCLACEEIYQIVKDEFDLNTFKLKETAANYGCARYGFSSFVLNKIEKTLNDVYVFDFT